VRLIKQGNERTDQLDMTSLESPMGLVAWRWGKGPNFFEIRRIAFPDVAKVVSSSRSFFGSWFMRSSTPASFLGVHCVSE